MSKDPLIHAKNVSISFRGAKNARPLLVVPEFSLAYGRNILITGDSGSGKSVFLKALLGKMPSVFITGEFVMGEKTMSYSRYQKHSEIRQTASVIFQDAIKSLHPYRSIKDQCPDKRDYFEALNLIPPEYFLDNHRMPGDCSGGECQRLSLLFVMADQNRPLVVMDEPLTDIDRISRTNIEIAITDMMNDPKKAVILVTHDTQWLEKYPDLSFTWYNITQRRLIPLDDNQALFSGEKQKPEKAPVPEIGHDIPPTACKVSVNKPFSYTDNTNFTLWPMELELKTGECLGLIGESGSGKTTLLKIIAGLLPEKYYKQYFNAEFRFDNRLEPILNRRQQRFRQIQIVLQDITGAYSPDETVQQDLNWIQRILKIKGKAGKKAYDDRVEELIDDLRLTNTDEKNGNHIGDNTRGKDKGQDFKNKRISALSIGTLRRYSLMRAFLLYGQLEEQHADGRSYLLLLDEVSRGLGKKDMRRLAKAILELRDKLNLTVLAISHDVDFLKMFCTRYRMMFKGFLLPKKLNREFLEVECGNAVPDGTNPYYTDFLCSIERQRRATNQNHQPERGCIYNHYYECVNRSESDKGRCRHYERTNQKNKVGICE